MAAWGCLPRILHRDVGFSEDSADVGAIGLALDVGAIDFNVCQVLIGAAGELIRSLSRNAK